MTNNHNHEAHRLRPIPANTVVHTPTEAEVKELLAILHENGYTYCDGESLLDNDWLIDLYDKYNELERLGIEPSAKITKYIEHCHIGWFRKQGYTILTLAEFKERYCQFNDNYNTKDCCHCWNQLDEESKEHVAYEYLHGVNGEKILESEKGFMSEDEYAKRKEYWTGWTEAVINTFPQEEMERYIAQHNLDKSDDEEEEPVETIQESEEKPQPKFNKGDMVVYKGKPYLVEAVTNMGGYYLYSIDTQECDHLAALPASDLEPYTEPETKPTEDMETRDDKKELNLCELLNSGDLLCSIFYSPAFGEVSFEENRASEDEIEIETKTEGIIFVLDRFGRMKNEGGVCILFPSRVLYEQYPLDPYTAWMKWQQEQLKCKMYLMIEDECNENIYADSFIFRTPSDRDKCIKEIKAIIEKYSKK